MTKTFPNVFMNIALNTEKLGRIEFSLFPDCPKTSENFRCLCTGEKKNADGIRLHYKGSILHKIVSGFMI